MPTELKENARNNKIPDMAKRWKLLELHQSFHLQARVGSVQLNIQLFCAWETDSEAKKISNTVISTEYSRFYRKMRGSCLKKSRLGPAPPFPSQQ